MYDERRRSLPAALSFFISLAYLLYDANPVAVPTIPVSAIKNGDPTPSSMPHPVTTAPCLLVPSMLQY